MRARNLEAKEMADKKNALAKEKDLWLQAVSEMAEKDIQNNPNDLNIGGNWFNGLTYNMRRWVPYNGGISKEQIAWLDNVLKTSYELNEKVVIFCHQPVYAINKPQSVVWNSEVVLEIIRKYGNVVIWIAGHDHSGQVNNNC